MTWPTAHPQNNEILTPPNSTGQPQFFQRILSPHENIMDGQGTAPKQIYHFYSRFHSHFWRQTPMMHFLRTEAT
jgi:hypothetical protein